MMQEVVEYRREDLGRLDFLCYLMKEVEWIVVERYGYVKGIEFINNMVRIWKGLLRFFLVYFWKLQVERESKRR